MTTPCPTPPGCAWTRRKMNGITVDICIRCGQARMDKGTLSRLAGISPVSDAGAEPSSSGPQHRGMPSLTDVNSIIGHAPITQVEPTHDILAPPLAAQEPAPSAPASEPSDPDDLPDDSPETIVDDSGAFRVAPAPAQGVRPELATQELLGPENMPTALTTQTAGLPSINDSYIPTEEAPKPEPIRFGAPSEPAPRSEAENTDLPAETELISPDSVPPTYEGGLDPNHDIKPKRSVPATAIFIGMITFAILIAIVTISTLQKPDGPSTTQPPLPEPEPAEAPSPAPPEATTPSTPAEVDPQPAPPVETTPAAAPLESQTPPDPETEEDAVPEATAVPPKAPAKTKIKAKPTAGNYQRNVDKGWDIVYASPAEAAKYFNAALEVDPLGVDALYGLGFAEIQRGNAEDGKRFMCKAKRNAQKPALQAEIQAVATENNITCD